MVESKSFESCALSGRASAWAAFSCLSSIEVIARNKSYGTITEKDLALGREHNLDTSTGSYTSSSGSSPYGDMPLFSTDLLTLNALENFPIGDMSQGAITEIRRVQGTWVDVDSVWIETYRRSKS